MSSVTYTFGTSERNYVVVENKEEDRITFHWTNKPYTMTGRQPCASGSFVMSLDEGIQFIKKARR